ncbi:hypothetical protein [Amycolatopsis sp. NPDC006125]|uniref:hypothetical protein n=1 Tax=Amycolatopsis sp. NPDC006125 TaxID=3156730 RepID=UPI0033B1A329
MKVELDLNEMLGMQYDEDGDPVGQRELRDVIVSSAAEQLVREIRKEALRGILSKVDAVVQDEVRTIVQTALSQPIQRTTAWGEPQGEPTSVLEIVREHVGKYLEGTGRRRDSRNREPQNLRELIDDSVRDVLNKEMTQAVNDARTKVNTEIRDHALKAAANALTARL